MNQCAPARRGASVLFVRRLVGVSPVVNQCNQFRPWFSVSCSGSRLNPFHLSNQWNQFRRGVSVSRGSGLNPVSPVEPVGNQFRPECLPVGEVEPVSPVEPVAPSFASNARATSGIRFTQASRLNLLDRGTSESSFAQCQCVGAG